MSTLIVASPNRSAKFGGDIDNLIEESEILNFAIPADDQRYTQSAAEGPLLARYGIQ
jgi:hypothetical protein